MQTLTTEQILSLAPDASSAKSGRELSSPRKWQNVGHNEVAVWGEHQGSGAKPYLTAIDLREPAFKCTCPSRKFPCKHGLGLFLAFANEQAAFPAANPPQWTTEWLASRDAKEEQAAKREERKVQEANDPEARAKAEKAAAKVAAQRKGRVDKGVEDLDRWLCDLIRSGFSSPNIKTYGYWESQAARLVDAQAPGLARIVRNMGNQVVSGTQANLAHENLLEEASRLHLLIQAYNRLDTLPPSMQDDVRTLVGWTQDQAELLASAPNLPGTHRVRDRWFVLDQEVIDEEKLRVQRTWLWGVSEPRAALILDFAFGNQPLDKSLVIGTQVEAELVYFPGAFPVRALVRERFGAVSEPTGTQDWTIDEALKLYSEALLLNPLLDEFPMLLGKVIPVHSADDNGNIRFTHVRGLDGDVLPVSASVSSHNAAIYQALSGGHPLRMFGTWNGKHFNPLNAWVIKSDEEEEQPQTTENTRNASEVEVAIWEALTTSALLGTERRPAAIPAAEGALGSLMVAIKEGSSSNSEQALLSAAATLTLYRRSGKLPAQDGMASAERSAPETLTSCSSLASVHLFEMLNGNNGGALIEWLEAAAARQKQITHDALPTVLDLGQSQPSFRPYILPVIGNRGRWLANQYIGSDKWDYVRAAATIETPDEESTLNLWETGSLEARFEVLRDIRGTQPDRAREMLEAVWKQENAKARAYLLRSLGTNLTLKDEPFFEAALDDRSGDVADDAANYLTFLHDSRLIQRATEAAVAALSYRNANQGKLFGLGRTSKGVIDVTLPEEYTPTMKRDRIEAKGTYSGLGDKAFWLMQLIGRTPLRTWTERWQAQPSEIIAASMRNKEWKNMLMQGWTRAIQLFQDPDWAEALLGFGFGPMEEYSPEKLVVILKPERRKEIVTAILSSHPEALYTRDLPLDVLWTLQKPWPTDLCRVVLKSIAHHIAHNTPKQNSWQVSQSLSTVAYAMTPAILPEAERILDITFTNVNSNYIKAAIDEFLTTLKFRHDMLAALA